MTLPDRPISAGRCRIATLALLCAALLSGCSQTQANAPTPPSRSGVSTPAVAPSTGATGSATVTSLGKDFVPDGWCKYVWDKAGLGSFIENHTGTAPADPRGSVDETADRRAVICSSSGVLITRATFSSPAAAQAALNKYRDSTLNKVHAGEESTVTIHGIRGDYAYVAGNPTLTSFNFGNGIYNGTEFVSVTLVVAGTPPTREVGKAKVGEVVGIASQMQLPQALAVGGE